jgi:hypothetical protein
VIANVAPHTAAAAANADKESIRIMMFPFVRFSKSLQVSARSQHDARCTFGIYSRMNGSSCSEELDSFHRECSSLNLHALRGATQINRIAFVKSRNFLMN